MSKDLYLIELTEMGTGNPLWINPLHIQFVRVSKGATYIKLRGCKDLAVLEPWDKIRERLNEAAKGP